MTNHSPHPWRYGEFFVFGSLHHAVFAADCNNIAMAITGIVGSAEDEESKENARRIVAAVNSVDGLIASLEQAINFIEHREANASKLTNAEQWQANVKEFRESGASAISIGRGPKDEAYFSFTEARKAIAAARGMA